MGCFSSIYVSGLPHRAVAVYMYLRGRADADGKCYPSIKTIGRELALSRSSTVKRALKEPEGQGFIRSEARWRENASCSSNMLHLS